MVYILCEGEENKSDYNFCEAVVKLHCTHYELISSKGNRNIVGTFEGKIVPKIKSGDKFALFFDSIEAISGTPIEDIIETIDRICKQRNVKFYHTTYYCMEEIFISYTYFLLMVRKGEEKVADKRLLKALEFAYESLNNGINYYQIANQNADLLQFIQSKKCTTREQCSKHLCYETSTIIGNLYRVTQKYIGDCWICNCDDIRSRRKNSTKCPSCQYNELCETFKQKLDCMERNSILRFGHSFSVIGQSDNI